jgi:ketosteroid isomerase-like protein
MQNEIFIAAFNSGDGALFDRLYRPDAVSNLTGKTRTGPERTKTITELPATKPRVRATIKHRYIAGDTCLFIVDFVLDTHDENGHPVRLTGFCTDVLVREPDGRWLMAIDRPVVTAQEPKEKL